MTGVSIRNSGFLRLPTDPSIDEQPRETDNNSFLRNSYRTDLRFSMTDTTGLAPEFPNWGGVKPAWPNGLSKRKQRPLRGHLLPFEIG